MTMNITLGPSDPSPMKRSLGVAAIIALLLLPVVVAMAFGEARSASASVYQNPNSLVQSSGSNGKNGNNGNNGNNGDNDKSKPNKPPQPQPRATTPPKPQPAPRITEAI